MAKKSGITFEQIMSDCKKKQFAPVYFLEGEEPYFIDFISDYIANNAIDESEREFNQSVLYGKDVNVERVISEAKRFPMMAEKQVLIIKEAQNIDKIENLEPYVENPQRTTILVLCYKYKNLDKRKSFAKTVEKFAILFNSAKLYDNEIPGWIEKFAKEKKVLINPQAIQLLAEYLGADLSRIVNEFEKLMGNLKNKSEVSDEEHQSFFRDIAHVGGAPWMVMHNRNEGSMEYTNLLYIPSIKPFDLFHPDRKCAIQLYVKRVFITEDNVQIIPPYLRFLRGIVDCADLPLNVSRETLQNNSVINKIKKSITNKVINELAKKASDETEKYVDEFWKNFGTVLKEGLCESMPTDEREKLLSICRFYSVKNSKFIGLEEYIKSMLEKQDHIFYVSGSSIESLKKNPNLEGFLKKNIDVLFFTDTVDDFWTTVTYEYQNIKFKSITRSDINLTDFSTTDEKEEKQELLPDQDKLDKLLSFMNATLKDIAANVRISNKLSASSLPTCLAVQEGAMDIRMEKFMIEQKQLISKSKKILEINPTHPVIMKLIDMGESDNAKDLIHLLFDQACIVEGEEIDDPALFVKRINAVIVPN